MTIDREPTNEEHPVGETTPTPKPIVIHEIEPPEADEGETCPVTLGVLTCPFKGPHTSHAFQSGTWAPDRKDDTDEGIE